MQMCMDHWNALREAVEAKGLATLVSESGEEVIKKTVHSMTEGITIDNFDPLAQANMAIMANAIALCKERGGDESAMELMGSFGVEWCPICYINLQHEHACPEEDCEFSFDDWVELAADEQLTLWKSLQV